MGQFGEYLRQARERAGLTQKEVADQLGLTSAQYISNSEREVAGCFLSPKHWKAVARMYKVSPQMFLKHYMRDHRERVKREAGI